MKNDRWGITLYVLLLLTVVRLWLMPIGSSLGLDETGTYYLATQGWGDYVAGQLPQIQSPLYTAFMHILIVIVGPNEVLLRLPSVIAMMLALVALYRIGARFADEEAGLIGVATFVTIPYNAFAAADARPYGLAMLASLGAMLMLLRWLDDGKLLDGVLYVLLAALTVHLHYLFATTVVIHGAYATMVLFRGGKVSARDATIAAALIALLLLPLVPIIKSLLTSPLVHAFAPEPGLKDFYGSFIPVIALSGLGMGLLVAALIFPGVKINLVPLRDGFCQLAFLWIVVPPACLFLFSRLSGTSVFVPRYYLPSFAGVAVLLGTAVRTIQPARVRHVTVGLLLLVGITSRGVRDLWPPLAEDWRGAIRAVRLLADKGSMPVLLETGFVEASNAESLTRAEYRKGMLAPLVVYPLQTDVVTLPTGLSEDSLKYIDRVVEEVVIGSPRFVLLSRGEGPLPWLRGRLWSIGYLGKSVGNFDDVKVTLFERRPER